MARVFASVDDLKAYLNPQPRGATEDALLLRLLEQASGRAEKLSGRTFLPNPPFIGAAGVPPTGGTDTAPPVDVTLALLAPPRAGPFGEPRGGVARIRVPDVRTLTAAADRDGNTIDPADVILEAVRPGDPAVVATLPYPTGGVTLTGRFGFVTPPPEVREAVVLMAARAVYDRNARLANTISDPEGGITQYFTGPPGDAVALLSAYKLPAL